METKRTHNIAVAINTFFTALRAALERGGVKLLTRRDLVATVASYPHNASPFSVLLYRSPDGRIWQWKADCTGYEEVERPAGSFEKYTPVVPRNFKEGPADPSWVKAEDALDEQWAWVMREPNEFMKRPTLEQIGDMIGSYVVGVVVINHFLQKEEEVRAWLGANKPEPDTGEQDTAVFIAYAGRFFSTFMPGMPRHGHTVGMYGIVHKEFYVLYKALTSIRS